MDTAVILAASALTRSLVARASSTANSYAIAFASAAYSRNEERYSSSNPACGFACVELYLMD